MKQIGYSKATWEANNPILPERTIGIETNTNKMKVGNGRDSWNELPYISGKDIDTSNFVEEAPLNGEPQVRVDGRWEKLELPDNEVSVDNVIVITQDTLLDESYNYRWLRVKVDVGNTITLTVPEHTNSENEFEASEITIECYGAGSVLVIPTDNSIELRKMAGAANVLSGYGSVACIKQVEPAKWVIFGGLEDL